ncbi:hypothetical protein [Rubrivirga sp. IMCC43871]|uniref:hypothetical protein n=1 Tax=Rubrivirga sp. IMCC43871 TaxID=3391575 RepID=UPI00398FA93B
MRALVAALVLVLGLPLAAQTETDACAPGYRVPGDGVPRIERTLPLETLRYLDTVQASPFVRAFLIAHLGANGAGTHPLNACSAQLLQTRLDDPSLSRRLAALTAPQMIEALVQAERDRRVGDARSKQSRQTLADVAVRASERLSLTNPNDAVVAAGMFQAVVRACDHSSADWCAQAASAEDALFAVVAAVDTLQAAEQDQDDLRRCVVEPAQDNSPPADPPEAAAADSVAAGAAPTEPRETVTCGVLPDPPTTETALRDRLRRASEAERKAAATVASRIGAAQGALALVQPPAAAEGSPGISIPAFGQGTIEVQIAAPEPGRLVDSGPSPSALPNLVIALADFVIDRARDEGILYLILRLGTWMEGTDGQVVRAGFPGTAALLGAVRDPAGPSIRQLAGVPLTTWRAALASDFERLPFRLTANTETALCVTDMDCQRRIRSAGVVLQAVSDLYDGRRPLQVLRRAPTYAEAAGLSSEFRSALYVVAGVAAAYDAQRGIELADAERFPYLLSAGSWPRIASAHRDAFVRVLVGDIRGGVAFDRIGTAREGTASVAAAVGEAVAALGVVAGGTRDGSADGATVVRDVARGLTAGLDLADALGAETVEVRVLWQEAGGVAEAFARGDHSLALARTMGLVQSAAPDALRQNGAFVRVAGLASSLAAARTQREAVAAFSAASSPLGGWQAKRFGEGATVTLTSYLGLGGGVESLIGDWAPSAVASPSLLIGLEAHVAGIAPGRPSFGVMVSVLDLGGLLSYRLVGGPGDGADGVTSAPNVTLAQVFAPGLHLAFGLGNTPATLVVGGQLTPALRAVREDGAVTSEGVFRVGASLALDLVLLEF